MPEKGPLEPHVFGKIEREGYSIEKVYFQTLPGFYLAGNLYRPLGRGKGPFPAILNPHGHWSEGRFADTKDGSIPARCISFARQGMLAFSYDMVGFNDTHFTDRPTNLPFYAAHRQFATDNTNLLWNISLMGLQTWNSIRALDFLASLPDADPKRLACTGESGGGTQTFMLGAVDSRLAAQAPVVMVSHLMQGGCLCENAPGLRVEYSNMEIAAAAAPRPQMLVAATGDWTKDTMTVEGPAIAHIYQLLRAAEKFQYTRFNFGHNYNQTSREAVYAWLGKWLLRQAEPGSLKEAPYQKEPDADLRVWPGNTLPADAVTQDQLIHSLVVRSEIQLRVLTPIGKRGLAAFKKVMLPAWKHTLQVEWPIPAPLFSSATQASEVTQVREYRLPATPSAGGEIEISLFYPAEHKSSRVVVLVGLQSALDRGFDPMDNSRDQGAIMRPHPQPGNPPPSLAKSFLDQGNAVIVFRQVARGTAADPFANFYCVYNRTEAQERVRNLLRICAFARNDLKMRRVVLDGIGRAGLWALLAAPAADAVIADCDGFDTSSDAAWLAADVFCPGIRKLGGFEGAAALAAPHPLLLQNCGAHFGTDLLRASYSTAGATAKLRLEAGRVPEQEVAAWVSQCR
jgi:hypothetical protein